MAAWTIVVDVIILLAGAFILGALCERLRQNAIVGYLLAGMLLGPNALNVIQTQSVDAALEKEQQVDRQAGGAHRHDVLSEVDVLAELGVALLLFSIGLEFSWRRLRRLGSRTFAAGVLQILLTLIFAAAFAALFVGESRASIAIGAMIALSSTACVLRMLSDRAEIDSARGRTAIAILLLQDIAIVPLVLLVVMLGQPGSAGTVLLETLQTILAAAVLVAVFYLLFNYAVPWLLGTRLMTRNRELPILLATVTGMGSALLAREAGVSSALGAFVAGMLLGSSPFAVQIRADISPLRTLLVTLFFSTVGMLANPMWIASHWAVVLGTVGAVIVGKTVIIWIIARILGYSHSHALASGIILAQVGEFSFVLLGLARGDVVSEDIFELVISVTMVTLILTPYLVAIAPRLGAWAQHALNPSAETVAAAEEGGEEERRTEPRVLIIGFGPAGQEAGAAMMNRGIPVAIIDLNPRTAMLAAEYGFTGHVGDATRSAVLEEIGLGGIEVAVVTIPDPGLSARVIHHVRHHAPQARVIVRARYHVYRWELHMAGADVVIDEEEQVGRRLAAELRKHLRASRRSDA